MKTSVKVILLLILIAFVIWVNYSIATSDLPYWAKFMLLR